MAQLRKMVCGEYNRELCKLCNEPDMVKEIKAGRL
jgi:hypothetical protein